MDRFILNDSQQSNFNCYLTDFHLQEPLHVKAFPNKAKEKYTFIRNIVGISLDYSIIMIVKLNI